MAKDKKGRPHYTQSEKQLILTREGLYDTDAQRLASVLDRMTYAAMNNLAKALTIIKRGKEMKKDNAMKALKQPKCFGKKDGYMMKCWQAHYPPEKRCELIEQCYQAYEKKR